MKAGSIWILEFLEGIVGPQGFRNIVYGNWVWVCTLKGTWKRVREDVVRVVMGGTDVGIPDTCMVAVVVLVVRLVIEKEHMRFLVRRVVANQHVLLL